MVRSMAYTGNTRRYLIPQPDLLDTGPDANSSLAISTKPAPRHFSARKSQLHDMFGALHPSRQCVVGVRDHLYRSMFSGV